MEYIKKLITFTNSFTPDIDSNIKGKKEIDSYLNDAEFLKNEIEYYHKEYDINLKTDNADIAFLDSFLAKWSRPEQKTKEGFLSGGFSFNGLLDIYTLDTKFWNESVTHFLKYDDKKHIDYDLLEQLKWLESPTSAHQGVDAEYTPFFGCVKITDKVLPSEFYYYDSGLIYKLPFKSYNSYIDALLNSSAVRCWQYFYVDAQEIIDKNKGVVYITWSNYRLTDLDDSITSMDYNENSNYDRLDLINEYLERCVRLLPRTFPFLNFDYHINFYKEFNELYLISKNN